MRTNFTKIIAGFIFAAAFTISNTLNAQIINTIAGNGTAGLSGDGGQATSAELNNPFNICFDNAGNMYIGDQSNNVIRQLNMTTGVITTFAGNGTAGFSGDNGQATAAQLSNPCGVAVDSFGNLYIGDMINQRIRKVVISTGVITTVAGNGGQSHSGDGGPATNANLNYPLGIAVDDTGNIYIADHYNECVRKVTVSTGIITTIGGNGTLGYSGDGGPATSSEMYYPEGVAVDDSENVYVADQWNNRIRKINQSRGIITSVAGNGNYGYSGDGGQATAAALDIISSVTLDLSGNLYIADTKNNIIREVVKSTGIITTVVGTTSYINSWTGAFSGDGGPATAANINQPYGVAIDKCGNIFIADETNQRIREVSSGADTVKVLPLAPIICNGASDTLKASGATNYIWSPNVGLSDTTGSMVIASPTVTTTYTIRGITSCSSPLADTVVVTVNPAPPLDIEPQSPTICNGQVIKLYVSDTGTNFTWSPSGALSASTGDTVLANPTINITYTVTGTNSSGCLVTGTDDISVVAAPNKPTINKSANGDTLISSATQGNQWFYNDTLINGASNQTLIITGQKTGSYTVEVINPANGCSATSDSLVASSINQLAISNEQVSIYPNPTTGTIFITINSLVKDAGNWNLEITDVLGRIIIAKQTLSYSNEIDLPSADGVYFLSITNKTGRTVFSLVKQ